MALFNEKSVELKMFFETPSKRPLEVVVMRDGKEVRVKIDMNSKI